MTFDFDVTTKKLNDLADDGHSETRTADEHVFLAEGDKKLRFEKLSTDASPAIRDSERHFRLLCTIEFAGKILCLEMHSDPTLVGILQRVR